MALTSYQRSGLTDLLRSEDTFATTIFFLLLDTFGTDMLEWDPETIWIETAGEFGVELPDINRDKVNALITFYTTNLFQTSLEMFINICNVLSGAEANFSRFDPADPDEMLWAFYELTLHADEPEELITTLDDEIRRYIGVTLDSYGVYNPPDLLGIAIMPASVGIEQFADDPDMYNALWDKQTSESTEMLSHVAVKMQVLIDELDRLPISSKGEGWTKFKDRMRSKLRSMQMQAKATAPKEILPSI